MKRECLTAKCDRLVMAKGLCNTHYHQVRRRGYTSRIGERRMPDGLTFESKLDYWTWIVEDGCHIYVRQPSNNGYCRIWLNKTYRYAHRVAYERAKGPLPDGLVVNHRCGVRSCVNPDHLEAVTQTENNQYQTVRRPSKSGYRGVTPHSTSGTWYASVSAFGARYRKGGFATPEDADAWARAVRAEMHPLGEFDPTA